MKIAWAWHETEARMCGSGWTCYRRGCSTKAERESYSRKGPAGVGWQGPEGEGEREERSCTAQQSGEVEG